MLYFNRLALILIRCKIQNNSKRPEHQSETSHTEKTHVYKRALVKSTWFEKLDYLENVSFKYVAEFGSGQALNIELDYEKSDEEYFDDYWGVAFDFYFDSTWSVGTYYKSLNSFNDLVMGAGWIVGEDTIGIRSTKFFTDQISLQGSYAVSDQIDSWSLGASYRF